MNSFQRLSSTVVWEKSFLKSERLRIWNFYPFHYADKVIGTIPFENLYLYLENVIVLLFYRAKLQYYGILSLNPTISLCTYHTFFHSLPLILKKKITYLRRIFRLRIRIPYSNSVKIRSSVRFIPPSLSLSL